MRGGRRRSGCEKRARSHSLPSPYVMEVMKGKKGKVVRGQGKEMPLITHQNNFKWLCVKGSYQSTGN